MDLPNVKMGPDQIEALFKDKEHCFSQMLPKETAYVNELGQLFAYMVQQFRVEIMKAEDCTQDDMRQSLRQVAQAMQISYNNHTSVWSDIEEKMKFKQ